MNKIIETKKFPKGHFLNTWIGLGMAIFSGLGLPLAFATDNLGLIGIGPAIGVGFGVAIGTIIEKRKEEQGLIRELTEEEILKREKSKNIGLGVVLLGILALAAFVAYKLL